MLVALALVRDGGDLPLAVQLLLAGCALVPWMPGVRMRVASPWFVFFGLVPPMVLLMTGAHPVLFGLLALTTARVATYGRVLYAALFAGAGLGFVVLWARELDGANWFVWKSYIELGLALGWALRGQRLLVVRAQETAAERAAIAAVEERRRIARDIHDTLAHSLTVMMVHLNSARLQLADDPEGVAESLDELAALGRASLDEARRSVGLLSGSPVIEPVDPTSAAAAVEELVGSFRRAGVDVELRTDVAMEHVGLLAEAPTTLWGASYRVIQESVANAAKHAPGTAIDIGIDIDDSGVHIEVVNALAERVLALDVPSGGHGILGMRERVALLQGEITAGVEHGRWVVRAVLPLSAAAEARRSPARRSRVLGRVS
ncbi:MAG TPA: histidine kinase [Acidimicrobiia bacterium]|nr:histidine kinase [Acidimicrobiia bacterium]